jgi:hypothetical protein
MISASEQPPLCANPERAVDAISWTLEMKNITM